MTAIHELKEKLKKETEQVKDAKGRLKEVQDKLRTEKEVRTRYRYLCVGMFRRDIKRLPYIVSNEDILIKTKVKNIST